MYSFLSLWANLLKFARTKTCEGIAEKKHNVDFVECATKLVKCVSRRSIPIGCFSKAVSVLNHTLPTAADIAMTRGVHVSPNRHLSRFVTRHAESLLESVPRRGGVLMFGGVAQGVSGDGATQLVNERGMRGMTLLIVRSCATTLTSSEGRVFVVMFVCCRFFGGVCFMMFVDWVTRDVGLTYVSRTKCISIIAKRSYTCAKKAVI